MSTDRPLAGTAAIVTGASRGLGREFAVDLAACGASLVLVARSAEGLAGTAALVARHGVECETIVGDVCDDALADRAVTRSVERFGGVDLLVNNAGIGVPSPVVAGDIDAWWDCLTINLRAPVRWTMAALPGMVARGRGRIINVSSPAGNHTPLPYFSAYVASKAGLSQFTASMAKEVAASGVAVLAFGPGALTDMTVGTWDNDVVPEAMKDMFRTAFTTDPDRLLRLTMELFRLLSTGGADHRTGTYLGMADPVWEDPSIVAGMPPTDAAAMFPGRRSG